MVKQKIIKYAKGFSPQILILMVFSFVLVTIIELLSLEKSPIDGTAKLTFDLDNLKQAGPALATYYTAMLTMRYATIMWQVNVYKANDETYLSYVNKINILVANKYRPKVFRGYKEYINKCRKIRAWKQLYYDQLNRLDKKRDLFYLNWLKFMSDLEKDPNTPAPNKWCKKRKMLLEKLDDDYIEKNIDFSNVNYNQITDTLIIAGIEPNKKSIKSDAYVVTKRQSSQMILADNLPSMMFSLAFMLFVASLATENFEIHMDWTQALMFTLRELTKIVTLTNVVFKMIKYSKTFNEKVTLTNIVFRHSVLCEYSQWIDQQIAANNLSEKDLEEETEDAFFTAKEEIKHEPATI